MSERRAHRRYTLWFPVHVATDGGETIALAVDAGGGGMLLSGADRLIVGAEVVVTFRVANVEGVPREIRGTIVRIEASSAEASQSWPHRMAIEFDNPEPELEALLKKATAAIHES